MRYALGVEYDGSDFLGWQRLSKPGERRRQRATVQQALETALSFVADAQVDTVCAGRTDAGVHAACQVVHFDTDVAARPARLDAGHHHAPAAIAICVRWCVPVADDFHARFSARARRYRYRILNRPVRPALGRQYLSWERRPLDADAMHRAAQALVGEHDFSAFRTVHCQAPHARRDLHADLGRAATATMVVVEVQANAFLHHMVRNIVGSPAAGRARRAAARPGSRELLAGRDRTVAGPTAPPPGLVFLGPALSCTNGACPPR